MVVTATDLKTNLGKYLDLLDTEDVIITRNGRRVAKLVRDEEDVLAEVQSLYGILATTGGEDNPDIPEERGSGDDSVNWNERNS